jgi:hypothetical protein
MMAEPPSALYVTLPGGRVDHIIGDDEHTVCGQPVPLLASWTREPAGTVCSKCEPKVEDGDET